jgi:hypothetical protein
MLSVSSFTTRPSRFAKEVVQAHGAAPARKDARHFVRIARTCDGFTAAGLGVVSSSALTSDRRDERMLGAVVVTSALFLLCMSVLPSVCYFGARLQRAGVRNFAFFFDSGLRGHTHLLFSVACFPLGGTNGVVLGMLLLANALFSWWLHCTRADAFQLSADTA